MVVPSFVFRFYTFLPSCTWKRRRRDAKIVQRIDVDAFSYATRVRRLFHFSGKYVWHSVLDVFQYFFPK